MSCAVVYKYFDEVSENDLLRKRVIRGICVGYQSSHTKKQFHIKAIRICDWYPLWAVISCLNCCEGI